MKTKPFNLTEALKPGAKVVTRDGKKVTIKEFKVGEDTFPLRAQWENDPNDVIRYYTDDGHYMASKHDSNLNLFLVDLKTYTLPLSRRDALEITMEMWDWLAENPEKTKADWLDLQESRIPQLDQQCACCEFTIDRTSSQTHRQCVKCPLQSLWGNTRDACANNQWSPYLVYILKGSRVTKYEVSKAAKQIADAARAELARMDAGKGKLKDKGEPFPHYTEDPIKQFQHEPQGTCDKIEPKDPYAHLREAVKQGKKIQINVGTNIDPRWHDITLDFGAPPSDYRIKPEPRYRAWNCEELHTKVGALLRHKTERFHLAPITTILCVRGAWVVYIDAVTGKLVNEMAAEKFLRDYEHSTDNGKTWLPCGVLVEE